jgi:branched-chain amino acid transport system substrate-binding protein
MGHDDFYFYPGDLANKFRADDRKVMESGMPFTTVEANQPEGGVRTIVSVTKVPLRDEYGRVIGLRAIWHSHPQLEVVHDHDDIKISYPSDADIFRLERNDDLSAANAWVPQFVFSDPIGGKLTLTVPASEAPSYFRLRLSHPVKIGALLSLTGDWSTLGQNVKAAMEIGLNAINLEELSRGSGLSFTSDIRDTRLDPATALSALQALAARGIKIVIGPQSSSEAALLKPFADSNGILLISPGSTASSLSLPADNLYRFCPDDTYEAKAMVALLKADDITAIVPMWRDDAGNQGLRNSMNLYFPQEGGAVSAGVKYSATQHEFATEIPDLSAQVVEAQKTHPGKVAVYLAAFDEVVDLFNEAKTNATLASVKWYGSDGVVQSQVLATNRVAAEFAAQHGYPCPTFGLDDRYRSTWGPLSIAIKSKSGNDVDAFALAGYDALRVAGLAYRAAGAEAQFADLKSAFIQSAASYSGATGETLLNAAGDRDGGAFDFWSLKANGDSFVWFRSISFEPTPTGGSIIRFP